MKMKKMVSGLVVLVMLCGLMTGCGGKETDTVVEGGKLSVGIPQNVKIEDYDNNAFTKYVEDNTGVEIEFVFFSSSASEYKQQLALMASANEELPDVLIGFYGLGSRTATQYGQDGYFLELTDLIDKYADTYKKQYEGLSEKVKSLVKRKIEDADTGSIYGMPKVGQVIIDSVQSLTFINQKWLDAVGMSAPTTTDELYAVLKAFATKDPNGNGKADEIPMLGGDRLMDYMINAFIYYEEAHPYNVGDDGKIYAPYIADEFRQALIYMNKLAKEGLYSDLSFTVTSNVEFKNLYTPTSGTSVVGVIVGHPSTRTNTNSAVLDEYVALAPLSDATGKGGYIVVSEDIVSLDSFITKDCENPALAMTFLDFFYEDETVTRARHGEKGVDWNEGTGKDIYGNDVKVVVVNGQAFFEGTKTWGRNVLSIQTPMNYNNCAQAVSEAETRVATLLGPAYEFTKNYPIKEDTVRSLEYTEAEDGVREQYESTLLNHVKEQAKLFITGTKNPSSDADWDAYVKQINEIGLTQMLEIQQSAYDRTHGSGK